MEWVIVKIIPALCFALVLLFEDVSATLEIEWSKIYVCGLYPFPILTCYFPDEGLLQGPSNLDGYFTECQKFELFSFNFYKFF